MTMAIIAAALATIAMLSHRGHNQTLLLQAEANKLHTKASDAWNFYQAKNIRSYEFQSFLMADMLQRKGESSSESQRIRGHWIGQVDKYEGPGFWSALESYLTGKGPERPKRRDASELAQLEKDARRLEAEAAKTEDASHHVHHAVNWLDYGHLFIELALVLASVSVLTKQRGFWFAAIAVAVVGAALGGFGVYALTMAPH
jgi:uncharacterized protein DUF4337